MNTPEYNREYYESHPDRKRQVLDRQRKIRDAVQAYKLAKGCAYCGYNRNARALQFHHHSGDKEHNISRMVGQGRKLESIMREVEKCEVVCANCHAEIHDGALV